MALLIISCIYLLLISATKLSNNENSYIDLMQIATSVENKISYEFERSDSFESSVPNEGGTDNYRQVKSLVYVKYVGDDRNILVKNRIVHESSNLYIENEGKYQIGNYVDKMWVKEHRDSNGECRSLSIRLDMKKGKLGCRHYFKIYI